MAETLNYRAASDRLHLSAPALSKQVRNLEAELGVRLFDRDTVRVRLTNAGSVFLADARRILADAERSAGRAREAESGTRGRLVVANLGSFTAGYMAGAVASFCSRFPNVEVELTDVEPPAQLEALEAQKIDIGMLPARSAASLPGAFRHVSVLKAPLRAILPRDHPLAVGRSVAFAQLASEKVICVLDETSTSTHRDFLHELFLARGLALPRVAEVRGVESLLAMIAGGQGVSILPRHDSLMRVDGTVMRAFKDGGHDTELELHAVWRDGPGGVMAENFVAAFKRAVDAHPGRALRPDQSPGRSPGRHAG